AGILLYAFSYGLIRFILEFLRDDGDLYAVINYNQIICAVLALVAAIIFVILIVIKTKKGEKIWYGKGGIPKELLPKLQVQSKSKKEVKGN
ncbi:MAG: prolipoprotein diacylglyceryl transferase, partial [Clostridia bacterium]|nr:prolipoprotein diacylglyceryl transferase [Clostridia bacterium]